MASNPAAAPAQMMPLFYNSIAPLSTQAHAGFGLKRRDDLEFTRNTHAIPLTVDEFPLAQRHFPIVFGMGDSPTPLALLGMTEGRNNFIEANGQWRRGVYVPAYVRRYPFMLARLQPDSDTLSLCFDDQAGFVVEDGPEALFDGDQASETTKAILGFCEEFERSVQRTQQFVTDLAKLGVLMDGEATIGQTGKDQPAIFRGFQMVNEEKLRELRGDQVRKIVQNGMLGMIYAHMFSLSQMRDLFAAQLERDAEAQQTVGNA